jgi:hypothetical protein
MSRILSILCFALLALPAVAEPAFAPSHEDAQLAARLVGRWQVQNVGMGKQGVVTFAKDGTYKLESGYFEAGGSWSTNADTGVGVTGGKYTVQEGVIGFTYDTWGADLPFSRLAVVLSQSRKHIVISTQGHTHGVEALTRIE